MKLQKKTEIQITVENEQPITTSRNVAENFDKNHRDVLRDIRNLTAHNDAMKNMFYETSYKNSRGQEYPEFLMNKDGFTLLAMGFTGEKALNFKLAYIEQFNEMEKQLQEIYHVSEIALTNNVMKEIETKLFTQIDERFEMYEENYRPTHANKMKINRYIKERLGSEQEENEAELVKQRVLLMLNAEHWQDIPYKQLIENMYLIDQSIDTVKGSRVRRQTELFNDFV